MNHKVTSFALILILFFAAIAVVTVEASSKNSCPHSKRSADPLNKRGNKESDKCPCALAQATFKKNVTGISVFAQDECGSTTLTGFLTGLSKPSKNKYTFLIVDQCENVIRNLTSALFPKIAEDGTIQFIKKLEDINLNCDKDGLLNIYCVTKKKCDKYYKRDGQGTFMRINQNGGGYAQAPISQI